MNWVLTALIGNALLEGFGSCNSFFSSDGAISQLMFGSGALSPAATLWGFAALALACSCLVGAIVVYSTKQTASAVAPLVGMLCYHFAIILHFVRDAVQASAHIATKTTSSRILDTGFGSIEVTPMTFLVSGVTMHGIFLLVTVAGLLAASKTQKKAHKHE